jgi:parvulin-like peptidyl-prolyl isomerase
MQQRFAHRLRAVLWALIIAFVIGLPLVFVPGRIFGGRPEQEQPETTAEEVVAAVNGQPVIQTDVSQSFSRMLNERLPFLLQSGQGIGIGQLWMARYQAFEEAIQRRLALEAARQQGISVSTGEVKKQAQQLVDQEIAQLKSQYQGGKLEEAFARIAARQGESPRETMSERQFAKWAMGRYLDKGVGLRDDLVIQKLQQTVAAQVSTSEQDLLQSYDRASVRHIVVMLHPEGKSPEAAKAAARADEQAKKRAEELLAKIKGGADFVALAKAESDDPAAKQNGGLMEDVGRGRMVADWDKAVFALRPGETSGPIKLPWGYEVVRMEKIGRELPPDFEKNKQQLLKSFTDQRRGEAFQALVTGLRQKAKVEVRDSEMQAYQALMQGKSEEAQAKLEETKAEARKAGGLEAASVFWELGTMLAGKKNWEEAGNAFAEAADALSEGEAVLLPAGRAEALMALANACEQQGKSKDAVEWYQAASDATEVPTIHSQLQGTFQKLGRQDLVKQEQDWLANYQQEQAERQAQMEAQRKAAEAKPGEKAPPPTTQAQPATRPADRPATPPAGAPQPAPKPR